jgi:Xaa-Pro aminopeptidase
MAGMNEAERKRQLALEAAGGRLVTWRSADVRWLLCGRGRPVSAPSSPYAVVLDDDRAQVWYQDIERSRVESEERWEEIGYEPVPYPWFEPHGLEQTPPVLDTLRLELMDEERERYREAGTAAAAAMTAAIGAVRPDATELAVAGDLAGRLHRDGFTTPVVLVGGERRQGIHRHPLPTTEPVGAHALLAVTAEREGLHVSFTRLVCFGEVPEQLERLSSAVAEIDACVLRASRPGSTLGEVFAEIQRAYAGAGFADEWRHHHQGGLTGYSGREVFAVPEEETMIPASAAVAWNPSLTGGAKSEDTALVGENGVEIVTRTPELAEVEAGGLVRPGITLV